MIWTELVVVFAGAFVGGLLFREWLLRRFLRRSSPRADSGGAGASSANGATEQVSTGVTPSALGDGDFVAGFPVAYLRAAVDYAEAEFEWDRTWNKGRTRNPWDARDGAEFERWKAEEDAHLKVRLASYRSCENLRRVFSAAKKAAGR